MSVYVLNGEIVAARQQDDDHHLIRRLWASQVIDIARVAGLEAMAELGESVFGVLLEEIEPELMEAILFERFRDNLATFLGNEEEPRFVEMSVVFVDNIQMGHDSPRLAADCGHLWQRAASVDPEMGIVPSHPEDAAGEQVLVLDALGAGRTVRAVLDDVPLEPVWARAMIAGMLDTGIVASSDVELADLAADDDATYEPSSEPTVARVPAVPDYDPTEIIEGTLPYIRANDGPTLETEIVESRRPKARKLGEVIAKKKTEPEPPKKSKKKGKDKDDEVPELELDPDGGDEEFEEDEPTVDASRPVRVPAIDHSESPDEPAEAEADEPEEGPDEPEETPDDFADGDEVDEADMPSGGQGVLDLEALFKRTDEALGADDELDLEAFADHDTARGDEGDGVFKTEDHNLDRIVVQGLDDADATTTPARDELEEGDDDEPIEADEAPHALFSGKLLSDDEALKKIDVANQAIVEVIAAFDASEGGGRGRATMQILLDGSPQRFAVLFQGLRLADDEVPATALLRNLHERPQTEHRQLLNTGLVDLIERALSLAMDEITDDAAIDTLLEKTAGYRQRIGL